MTRTRLARGTRRCGTAVDHLIRTASEVAERGDPTTGRSSSDHSTDASDPPDDRTAALARVAPVCHGAGVLLAAAALALVGLDSPGVAFPVAVGLLAAFGLRHTPPYGAPTPVLRVVRGGPLDGGLRQGVVIKSLFAAALLYRGAFPVLTGAGEPGLVSLLLAGSLAVSAAGTWLTARAVGRLLAVRDVTAAADDGA